jgi:holo-[acyl-carrier protein] synthase
MIVGIGVDIVDVSRIEQRLKTNEGFLHIVFSKSEITYCESKANPYESFAARFAAKEAFLKALGIGIDFGIEFKEIVVLNNEVGKPSIVVSELLKTYLIQHLGFLPNIQLSLSHTKEQAIAFVLFNKI